MNNDFLLSNEDIDLLEELVSNIQSLEIYNYDEQDNTACSDGSCAGYCTGSCEGDCSGSCEGDCSGYSR